MSPASADRAAAAVRVRYWAAARAAAGADGDDIPVAGTATVADVLAEVRRKHDDSRFSAVLDVCSILVGDTPVGGADPARVSVRPGDTVELLPPFAGG
jgi:molybdopterin converting factor small subunit